jgi:hypothetical protein
VSCLIKWQPVIVAPFLLLHALSLSKGYRKDWRVIGGVWLRLIAPALGVILLAVATFGYQPIAASLHDALNHTFLSGNALNFNWIVTYLLRALHPDRYGAMVNGIVSYIGIDPSAGWVSAIKLTFVLFYLGAFWRLFKMRTSFRGVIECSLAGYLSYFIFNIGVHENHLFLATILAAIGATLARDKRLRAILIVALSNLNLITFYGLTGAAFSFSPVVGIDVSLIFAAVNVLLFLFFWGDLVLRGRSISNEDRAPA